MSNSTTSQIMSTKTGRQTHVAPTGSTWSVCGVRVTKVMEGASVTCERCAESWSTQNAFSNTVEVVEKAETTNTIETTTVPLTLMQMRKMQAGAK